MRAHAAWSSRLGTWASTGTATTKSRTYQITYTVKGDAPLTAPKAAPPHLDLTFEAQNS